MHFTYLVSMALATSLVAATPLKPRELGVDDMMVVVDGQITYVKKADYMTANNLPIAAPIENNIINTNSSSLSKRCQSAEIVYANPDQNFLQWDVPMSSVVRADTTPATVAVTEGYSLANAMTITGRVPAPFFEGFFTANRSAAFAETWTTTYTAATTFTVPAGHYGVVVSNPKTRRLTGYVNTGCVGDAGSMEKTTYSADTYTSKAYGGLSWVDGIISLCTSTVYPIPNCVGDGFIS